MDFKNYAINYYLRYYPSKQRLSDKLNEKYSLEVTVIKKLLEEMSDIIVEDQVIEAKINSYIYRGKNVRYIKQNLLKKKFKKEDIDRILEKFIEKGSILDETAIISKIKYYKSKHKSITYVKMNLIERREDEELISRLIEKAYPDGDGEQLEKEYKKISYKYDLKDIKSKQKLIEALLRKGFSYGGIKSLLEE